MKNRYELMYILKTESDNETSDYSDQIRGFEEWMEQRGAEIENIDEWGVRSLAYEINNESEGYYVLMEFSYESSNLSELEEKFKLSDKVLRHLLVRKD